MESNERLSENAGQPEPTDEEKERARGEGQVEAENQRAPLHGQPDRLREQVGLTPEGADATTAKGAPLPREKS